MREGCLNERNRALAMGKDSGVHVLRNAALLLAMHT